jgi:hypothetical protein
MDVLSKSFVEVISGESSEIVMVDKNTITASKFVK